MQLPLQISFRHMPPSPAVEAKIHERVAKLERFFPHLVGCHVVVEAPHRHHHKGKLYQVSVDLSVPGGELVVNHAGPKDHAHEDVYVALRDAFDAARRRLESYSARRRLDVKVHEVPLHGRIERLYHYEGYGFVAASDGREIYFHKNSVIDGLFDDLAIGSEVRLAVAEKEGENGPQASTIQPVGKHHLTDGTL